MNREVHVRFWERPVVKVLRATRQGTNPLSREKAARVAVGVSVADSQPI
jgi:hypothetical protein